MGETSRPAFFQLTLPALSRHLLSAVVLTGLAAGCERGATTSEQARAGANLLVIVVDTLRADHLGCYGYERATSPNLDQLASNSFHFLHGQSAAPWTAPALLSLMTSLYPETHGVREFPEPGRMSEKVETLAEVVGDSGYATAAFTEGGYAKGEFGLDQGFDSYPGNPGDVESHVSNVLHPSRLRRNIDRALEWLQSNSHQPFLLFFHTYEPHEPYRAPEAFIQKFRPSYNEAQEHAQLRRTIEAFRATGKLTQEQARLLLCHRFHCALAGLPPIQNGATVKEASLAAGVDPQQPAADPEVRQFILDLYDAEVAYTDSELPRLWQALETAGVDDRTVVAVVSDHGEGLGDRGRIGHGRVLHDELLRMAFLLRIPWLPLRSDPIGAVVRSVDLMPTLLESVGLPAPAQCQGFSLLPLLFDGAAPQVAFSHALSTPRKRDTLHSVCSERWRLVLDLRQPQRPALYDRQADPRELLDRAAGHPNEVARLTLQWEDQRRRNLELAQSLGGPTRSGPLDASTERDLRALGYLDDDP